MPHSKQRTVLYQVLFAMTYPTRSNLRRKALCLPTVTSCIGKKHGGKGWHSTHFLCSAQSRTPAQETVLYTFMVALPQLIRTMQTFPHRHAQWFVSQVIIDTTGLAIRMNMTDPNRPSCTHSSLDHYFPMDVEGSLPLPLAQWPGFYSIHDRSVFVNKEGCCLHTEKSEQI